MKGFVVKALTLRGRTALDVCIQEGVRELCKRSLLERMKFHKIWIRKISRNPLTDSWTIHPDAERLLLQSNPRLIVECVSEVKVAMKKMGAEVNVDFVVEVLS